MPACRRRRSDEGVIIILFALLVVVLIGLLGLSLNVGYSMVVRGELQAAADAAAHAGASRLDSSLDGWNSAREAALAVLAQHSVRGGLQGTSSLNLDASNTSELWDLSASGNLTVRIERGLMNSDGTFLSLEDWEHRNPNIAGFFASNAVRLEIRRPRTVLMPSPWPGLPDTYALEATSIALRAPVERVCAAPLAIPVCALLDSGGAFQAEGACRGDRIFTSPSRYCPGNSDCGALPSSPYSLCSSSHPPYPGGNFFSPSFLHSTAPAPSMIGVSFSGPNLPQPKPGVASSPARWCYSIHGSEPHPGCDLHTFRNRDLFPQTIDHYGVFGLPGATPVTESSIQNLFTSPNSQGCTSTGIGQQFRVLEGSLTQTATEDLLWRRISTPASDAPSFGATELGTVQNHYNLWDTFGGSYGSVTGQCTVPSLTGMCNSRRGAYRMVYLDPNISLLGFQLYSSIFPNMLSGSTEDISDATTVWHAKASVIARLGTADASPCQGLAGAAADPIVAASQPYIVIGFVDLYVYDLDIGHQAPAYSISGLGALPPEMTFTSSCNNVRGRLTCGSRFVPSSSGQVYDTVRFAH